MSESNESLHMFAQVQEMFQHWQVAYHHLRKLTAMDIERDTLLAEATTQLLASLHDDLQTLLEAMQVIHTNEAKALRIMELQRAIFKEEKAQYVILKSNNAMLRHMLGPG